MQAAKIRKPDAWSASKPHLLLGSTASPMRECYTPVLPSDTLSDCTVVERGSIRGGYSLGNRAGCIPGEWAPVM